MGRPSNLNGAELAFMEARLPRHREAKSSKMTPEIFATFAEEWFQEFLPAGAPAPDKQERESVRTVNVYLST